MACISYNVLSELSVKRVNDKLYNCMHYSERKWLYLQIFKFTGAMVSEFHFFMKIKNKCRTDTSELKGHLVYLLGIKCKLQVHFKKLLHYNDISITRSKRVNVLCYTLQEEDQFPCKSSGSWFTQITCYDIDMACIIILYCQDSLISIFTRYQIICQCTSSEENLFTYKIGAIVIEFRIFKRR